MTDKNLVTKKLTYMIDALGDLEKAIKYYKDNHDSENQKFFYYAAQKKAEEIVESAISVNQMILMEEFNKQSDNYYLSFMDLGSLDIFTEMELEKMAQTTGFRNRLAHEYVNLDPEITKKSMENILKLYPSYIKKIMGFMT